MKSTITFLGTAGDTMVMAKQQRASAGMVITSDAGQFHIDPGPGALAKLRLFNISSRETTAIFCTNDDLLNANDCNALVAALTLEGLDKQGIAILPEQAKRLEARYEAFIEKALRVSPGKRFGINETDILTTSSTRQDSVGFVFQFPGFTVGYVGDTGYHDELLKEFRDVNILVLKCKNPAEFIEQDCLNTEDVQKIVNHTKPDLAVLTGLGTKMLETDILNQARTIQKSTNVQTIIANDGMRITPASYTKSGRQQTLNRF